MSPLPARARATGRSRTSTLLYPASPRLASRLDLNLAVTNLNHSGESFRVGRSDICGRHPSFQPANQAANCPHHSLYSSQRRCGHPLNQQPRWHAQCQRYRQPLGHTLIEQDGCCPATVTMDHDTVSGSLTVEEGVGNGDTITLTDSTAGATTLIQGYGPTMAGCDGTGDWSTSSRTTERPQLGYLAWPSASWPRRRPAHPRGHIARGRGRLTGFGITATQSNAGTSARYDPYRIDHVLWPCVQQPIGPVGPPSIVTLRATAALIRPPSITSTTVPGNIHSPRAMAMATASTPSRQGWVHDAGSRWFAHSRHDVTR